MKSIEDVIEVMKVEDSDGRKLGGPAANRHAARLDHVLVRAGDRPHQRSFGRADAAFEPLRLVLRLVGLGERHTMIVRHLVRDVSAVLLADFLEANRHGRPGFAMPDGLAMRVRRVQARWRL
jgi:hypothetical protein